MWSSRGELSAWDAIKWFLRIFILSVIFVAFAIAAVQFIEVEYDSKQARADSLTARLLYTDAFFVKGQFDPERFTIGVLESRFAYVEVPDPQFARTAARITLETPAGTDELFIDERSYRFHLGTYLGGRAAVYTVVETPVELVDGSIGYYKVEVVSG